MTAGTKIGDTALQPIPYRLRWRPESVFPGAHPGPGEGVEGEFRRHVSLLRRSDPRRIDLRASLRDPFQDLRVREFAPRRSVPVAMLIDLSGSMGFGGAVAEQVARLGALIALSARRSGDSFALFGCDARMREDVHLPFTRRAGIEDEVRRLLEGARMEGEGTEGLLEAARRLPARRSLVFLVSDFLMPRARVAALLDRLWRHDVVPVVARHSAVEEGLPRWGLIETVDLETRAHRLVLMRPSLRTRWLEVSRARRQALEELFRQRGCRSFDLVDRLDTEALARRLMAG
ncbi:DUF58 domain-containing protein [Ancylobacter mangrovi]|uniref:DUF58 domain-containing protein n=1 Tax=Ancylobacter mangrovi TaxID=2972472 RepID=UPI002162A972|nr:DUF58 domain-containing protein [Ancylobacter mangrovi]MCS0504728.1 DUF58 domain-containing protein [Ancylobacter mangrovi]